jgi:hypothetical protein
LAVAHFTLTGIPLALERRTVKLRPALASLRVASPIDSVGAPSSSVIFPTPRLSEMDAPAALERLRSKVSSGSSVVSPLIGTRTVFEVVLGTTVSRPDVCV